MLYRCANLMSLDFSYQYRMMKGRKNIYQAQTRIHLLKK